MKTNLISHQTTAILPMLAVAAGLMICAGSAQAQFVTGQQYLSNISPSGTFPSGNWTVAGMADTATGLSITALGGPGSFSTLYYPLPAGQVTPLNPADTQVTFTWTWTAGDAVAGINVLFALDDANGGAIITMPSTPAYSITPHGGAIYVFDYPSSATSLIKPTLRADFPSTDSTSRLTPLT